MQALLDIMKDRKAINETAVCTPKIVHPNLLSSIDTTNHVEWLLLLQTFFT